MEKFGWAGTYLLLAATGVATFVTGAPTIRDIVGVIWVIVLSILITTGGLLAAYGVYRDYRFEAGGALTLGTGLAIYGSAIWYVVGNSATPPIHSALFITAIIWAALMRFLYINHVRHRLYAAINANDQLEKNGH